MQREEHEIPVGSRPQEIIRRAERVQLHLPMSLKVDGEEDWLEAAAREAVRAINCAAGRRLVTSAKA
ncbi:MAG: hypothetical protein GTN78_00080, partial [Gemmatimonadales bacterium]|nr:hypothetical protein [Gemmatimonadales bacterium]